MKEIRERNEISISTNPEFINSQWFSAEVVGITDIKMRIWFDIVENPAGNVQLEKRYIFTDTEMVFWPPKQALHCSLQPGKTITLR